MSLVEIAEMEQKCAKWIEDAESTKENAEVARILLILRLIAAVETWSLAMRQIEEIRGEATPDEPWRLACVAFEMGTVKEAIHSLNPILVPEALSVYQSMAAAKNAETQWKSNNQSLEKAVQDAAAYYENGGADLHNVLANRLAREYGISKNTLRGRIKPIARKYGKVKGDKK